mgnify:CR=1 FL=1
MRELCYALRYLHNKDFVHRDLKPENVCISRDGSVRILVRLLCFIYYHIVYKYIVVV